ncbi:hypothetical protein [Tychonema sp. LEGE 07203]|uniref:hypothetical protein n=1 Tax=Tychonema sp. LEGE 07203 TaxID=1828671 RepID=UPI00187E068D|nr:hypothetical protein [Tychonema sp. LEGE 07203]MBE9097813.1 hypothetical protein [Tychonema sp. LEGE 07203]
MRFWQSGEAAGDGCDCFDVRSTNSYSDRTFFSIATYLKSVNRNYSYLSTSALICVNPLLSAVNTFFFLPQMRAD